MKKLLFVVLMLPLIAFPAWAQEEKAQEKGEEAGEAADKGAAEATGEARDAERAAAGSRWRDKEELLRAIRLPEAAEEARQEGVPAEDVKEVLEAARDQNLPAGETETIMVEETKAVQEKGEIDNFGSFVKSKLDEGLRGRELSDAIREEHAARGKGKGHGKTWKQGAGERDEGEADGSSEKHDKQQGKGRQQRGMSEDIDRLEEDVDEDVAEGEEVIREKSKAEKKKWNRGKKKPKEELPPEGDNN